MIDDDVCCKHCKKNETTECPVKNMVPCSSWANWCSAYVPNRYIPEEVCLLDGLDALRNGAERSAGEGV